MSGSFHTGRKISLRFQGTVAVGVYQRITPRHVEGPDVLRFFRLVPRVFKGNNFLPGWPPNRFDPASHTQGSREKQADPLIIACMTVFPSSTTAIAVDAAEREQSAIYRRCRQYRTGAKAAGK